MRVCPCNEPNRELPTECPHQDIERGAGEFTPDRCRACFAAVFPPPPPSAKPPPPPRLTDAEAQYLATSVVTAPSGDVPSAIGRLAAKVLELLARVPHDAPPTASPGSSGEAGKQCETCGHTEGQEAPQPSSTWYRGKPIDISCPTCGWMGEVAR